MTTRKTTTKTAESEIEQEVSEENVTSARTFTAIVNGAEREFEDMTGGKPPSAVMMLGNERTAAKYAPLVLEAILGEEVLFDLFEEGISIEEMQDIFKAWNKSIRGKGTGSDK